MIERVYLSCATGGNGWRLLHNRLVCGLYVVGALCALGGLAAPAKAQAPTVTTDKTVYDPSDPIIAEFDNGPGNATDWLGIYPAGETPDGLPAATAWYYVNGSQTAGDGLTSGQVTFNTQLSEGDWVLWLLENDGYTALAQTAFQVSSSNGAIRIGPYLQNATSTSIAVMWETSAGTESRVDYGLTNALGTTVGGTVEGGSLGSQIHTVELTGLQPDTYYYYKIVTGADSSEIRHFRTMPTDREVASRFVVYSDMQEQGSAPTNVHGRIVNESIAYHVPQWTGHSDYSEALDFVLVPGDLVASGGSYSDWETQFFDEAQTLIQDVPYFTALGNHEGNHANYYKFMTNPGNGTASGDEQWYAFDHGNIRVITLNSNNSDSAQLDWLDTQLSDACWEDNVDFVFAQFHHAHISETWLDGESTVAASFVARLVDFSRGCGKASVHFYGHNHSYQRGQVRDHAHFYMDVSGAEGDLAYWGDYDQSNSDVIQKSIVQWGWSFVEAEAGSDPRFAMRRVGLGGEDQDYAISYPGVEIDFLSYRPASVPPAAPVAIAPVAGVEVADSGIVLQASAFAGQEPGTSHLASHFQVTASSGDYESPVEEQWFRFEDRFFKVNLNAGVDLTQSKHSIRLSPNTTYYWRVRYRDSGFKWSPWSEEASFVTVPSANPSAPAIRTDRDTYDLGDPLAVHFSAGPANRSDWVGVYPAGVQPGSQASTVWSYLNNTQTVPDQGLSHGSVVYDSADLAGGTWDVHLLADGGYTSLAMQTITVTASCVSAGSACDDDAECCSGSCWLSWFCQ